MTDPQPSGARTRLGPDAWHQADDGNYYVDCPECGSAATLMNVVEHGRCNGYLDQREEETDLDEVEMDCTARLAFELVWDSDPGSDSGDEAVAGADGEGGDRTDVGADDPGDSSADSDSEGALADRDARSTDEDADADRPANGG